MKIKYTIIGLLIVTVLALVSAPTCKAIDYRFWLSNHYVDAITGLDTNPGTISSPWKTITKANAQFSTFLSGDSLLFAAGQSHSGQLVCNKAGVIISRYGTGADPIITGWTTFTGWTTSGGNLWTSSTISPSFVCNVVSINGVNTAQGRTPNAGTFWTILSTNGTTTVTDATHLNAGTLNWSGATVVVRSLLYEINKGTISSASGATITSSAIAHGIPANWGYFLQNDVRTLDQPNEWFFNGSTNRLTIYSTTAPTNVKGASLTNGISINGFANITIDRLDIQGYNGTGILGNGVGGQNANCTVKNCSVSFTQDAMYFYPNSPNLIVRSCTVLDNNSRGIDAGSSSSAIIQYNNVQRTGMFAGMGGSGDDTYTAIIANGDNSQVLDNNIVNAGYCGIRFDGGGTIVARNYVNQTNFVKDDGGGIYGYSVQNGNAPVPQTTSTVRDNTVLNFPGAPLGSGQAGINTLGAGIYLDGQKPNVNVLHNTVGNDNNFTGNQGLFSNGGRNNTFDSNTVYNCFSAFFTQKQTAAGGSIINLKLRDNIFVEPWNTSFVCNNWHFAAYFKFDSTAMPPGSDFQRNVYANPLNQTNGWIFTNLGGSNNCYTLSQWKTASSQDAASTSSPLVVASLALINFTPNATASALPLPLPGTYTNMLGLSQSGVISIPAYSAYVGLMISTDNPGLKTYKVIRQKP